jgi:hypothetical protein
LDALIPDASFQVSVITTLTLDAMTDPVLESLAAWMAPPAIIIQMQIVQLLVPIRDAPAPMPAITTLLQVVMTVHAWEFMDACFSQLAIMIPMQLAALHALILAVPMRWHVTSVSLQPAITDLVYIQICMGQFIMMPTEMECMPALDLMSPHCPIGRYK